MNTLKGALMSTHEAIYANTDLTLSSPDVAIVVRFRKNHGIDTTWRGLRGPRKRARDIWFIAGDHHLYQAAKSKLLARRRWTLTAALETHAFTRGLPVPGPGD
jgi:hypothetical protein